MRARVTCESRVLVVTLSCALVGVLVLGDPGQALTEIHALTSGLLSF